MKNAKNQGFTLVELLVVIAIIGLLATFAIPSYRNYIARGETTSALNTLDGVRLAVEDALLRGADPTAVALPDAPATNPSALGTVAVAGFSGANAENGTITFTFNGAHSPRIQNTGTLTFTRTAGVWACTSSADIDADIRPKGCN